MWVLHADPGTGCREQSSTLKDMISMYADRGPALALHDLANQSGHSPALPSVGPGVCTIRCYAGVTYADNTDQQHKSC
jgi:hypothetical protein